MWHTLDSRKIVQNLKIWVGSLWIECLIARLTSFLVFFGICMTAETNKIVFLVLFVSVRVGHLDARLTSFLVCFESVWQHNFPKPRKFLPKRSGCISAKLKMIYWCWLQFSRVCWCKTSILGFVFALNHVTAENFQRPPKKCFPNNPFVSLPNFKKNWCWLPLGRVSWCKTSILVCFESLWLTNFPRPRKSAP